MNFKSRGRLLSRPFLVGLFFTFHAGLANAAELVMTFGGDVNFARDEQIANPRGVFVPSQRRLLSWEEMTAQIKPLIDGDLNFANIETVISGNENLSAENKRFQFVSHPNGILHLIDIGMNVFNLANNHSYDYGISGIEATLSETEKISQRHRNVTFVGLAHQRNDFLKPQIIEIQGYRIAIQSVSITDPQFRATQENPGQLSYRANEDWNLAVQSLDQSSADFKILSVHSGIENKTTPEEDQIAKFREAVDKTSIDLIIGHHPHVVRPIEKRGSKFIFYSLGNYLMTGAANMAQMGPDKDWGLFAKIYLNDNKVAAIEIIPLNNMHFQPRPYEQKKSMQRLQLFNSLNKNVFAQQELEFKISAETGYGILCLNPSLNTKAFRACQSTK